MKNAYLIFDLGTGNSRAALIRPDGTIIGIHRIDNIYHLDPHVVDAKYFIPQAWLEKLLSAARKLLSEHPEYRVTAVSSTSAREGIVLLDKDARAFIGLPNVDNRGKSLTQYDPFSAETYKLSGHWLAPLFSALKLAGYREQYPDEYNQISGFTSISEWIGLELTGQLAITPSQACETQLFDTSACTWSDRLCSIFSVPAHLLPNVQPSGTVLGKIKPAFRDLGNVDENAVFILAGADTQTAAHGLHAASGNIAIISGTTSPIVSMLSDPLYDKEERCWLDCGLKHNWSVETNAGATGINFQAYRNRYLPTQDYQSIEQAIAQIPDFKCIASFATKHFSKKKTLRHGGFLTGAPYSALQIDHYDYLKAMLADIACGIALHLEDLCQIIPHSESYVLGGGGGFQSLFLGQWVSDLTGKEILLPHNYAQASLQGCLEICNQCLQIETPEHAPARRIVPQENPALQDYYHKWTNFRNSEWVLGDE